MALPTENINPTFRKVVDHVQYAMVQWRIFPIGLLLFWTKISFDVMDWMRTASMDGVGAAAILGATLGPAAAYFKFYVETGPNGKYDASRESERYPPPPP